jgi:hypothetical protein
MLLAPCDLLLPVGQQQPGPLLAAAVAAVPGLILQGLSL